VNLVESHDPPPSTASLVCAAESCDYEKLLTRFDFLFLFLSRDPPLGSDWSSYVIDLWGSV